LGRKNELTWRGLPTDPKIPFGLQIRPKKVLLPLPGFGQTFFILLF
jgi:hypothetical protein